MGIFDKIFSRKDTHKNEKKEQIYQNEARPNINCEKMEKDDYEEIAKIEIHIEKDKVFSENELENEEKERIMTFIDFKKEEKIGKYLNYAYFFVTGTDEKGKHKTKRFEAVNEQQAIEFASLSDLSAPFVVKKCDYEEPTERQLNLLKEKKVKIPFGITKDDALCMISRIIEEDSICSPKMPTINLAEKLQIRYSAFIGENGLLSSIFYQSSDRDRAALYVYAVEQNKKGKKFLNMFDEPEIEKYYDIADKVICDAAALRSLNDRKPNDFQRPNKGTLIYKTVEKHLKEEL
ncbi:MAG: hypothetical protein IJE28_00740 [Oscillospiraceae bacterium]|nr:hypothetical protein [Oscillospiraceae bacterium]